MFQSDVIPKTIELLTQQNQRELPRGNRKAEGDQHAARNRNLNFNQIQLEAAIYHLDRGQQ